MRHWQTQLLTSKNICCSPVIFGCIYISGMCLCMCRVTTDCLVASIEYMSDSVLHIVEYDRKTFDSNTQKKKERGEVTKYTHIYELEHNSHSYAWHVQHYFLTVCCNCSISPWNLCFGQHKFPQVWHLQYAVKRATLKARRKLHKMVSANIKKCVFTVDLSGQSPRSYCAEVIHLDCFSLLWGTAVYCNGINIVF